MDQSCRSAAGDDIWNAIEPLEREAAKGRQGERTDKHWGNFPQSSHGKARDKVAAGAQIKIIE